MVTLTSAGLRERCPDGHLIYWHAVDASLDYGREGKRGGICTAGQVWNQDKAWRGNQVGRLRRAEASPLLSGSGLIRVQWTLTGNGQAEARVEVRCRRGGHAFDSREEDEPLPQARPDQPVGEYLSQLRERVGRAGWSVEPRVECAHHRAERTGVEVELARLRELEAAPSDRPDEDGAGSGRAAGEPGAGDGPSPAGARPDE